MNGLLLALLVLAPAAVETFTLDNGLTVILDPLPDRAAVAVSVRYAAGSMHDPQGRTGLAHFVEHMMFHESGELASGELVDRLESAGGIGINATTGFDRTEYHVLVPPDALELALSLEAQRMQGLGRAVRPERIEMEKRVVENELFDRVMDTSFGFVETLVHERVYPNGHPLHRLPIGTLEDIDEVTVEDVRWFFGAYYGPNNATLAIVGRFDPSAARSAITARFGGAKSRPVPDASSCASWKAPRRAVEGPDWASPRPRVSLRWKLDGLKPEERDALDVAATLLGSAQVSRGGLANLKDESLHGLEAQVVTQPDGPHFRLDAILAPGTQVEIAHNLVLAVVQSYGNVAPTKEEMRAAKRVMRLQHERALASPLARAAALQWARVHLGDPKAIFDLPRRWDAVTSRAVQAVMGRRLEAKHMTAIGRPVRR